MFMTILNIKNVKQKTSRTDVSDRLAAILLNATLKDMGIITKDNYSKVVDRSTIRSEIIKKHNQLKSKKEVEISSSKWEEF